MNTITFVQKMIDLVGHIPPERRDLWPDKSFQFLVPLHGELVFEDWDEPMFGVDERDGSYEDSDDDDSDGMEWNRSQSGKD